MNLLNNIERNNIAEKVPQRIPTFNNLRIKGCGLIIIYIIAVAMMIIIPVITSNLYFAINFLITILLHPSIT